MQDRPDYHRAIAEFFIKLRGAPFILSPSEYEYIERWARADIPLHVVLEGLRSAYEIFRTSPRRRKKLSIAFCHSMVLGVFRQYLDRRVGSRRNEFPPDLKYERIRKEIESFLSRIPESMEYLRELFVRAESILSGPDPDPEELENIDFAVEQRILIRASEQEQAVVEKEADDHLERRDPDLRRQTIRRLLVKSLREKHQIPYIAPFYY